MHITYIIILWKLRCLVTIQANNIYSESITLFQLGKNECSMCVFISVSVMNIFIHVAFVCGNVFRSVNINPPSSTLVKCQLILEKETCGYKYQYN